MGFPVGYSEMPRLVLNLLFLLGHLRRLSSWLTGAPDYTADLLDADLNPLHQQQHEPCDELELEEHFPAVRFDALLSASGAGDGEPEACAVCLADFRPAARVRRPRGCRHVFHRSCLDRWANHGHRTCPICRAPLLIPPPPPSHAVLLLPMPLPAS